MTPVTNQQTKLRQETRTFGFLAVIATTISLLSVGGQIVSVAAPLWKGGPIAVTFINVGKQMLLSAPVIFYVVGLIHARRIFRRIGAGELFSSASSEGLVTVGKSILIGALWTMVVAGLDPAVEYYGHAVSHVGFVASGIALSALGLALIVIGRVMIAASILKAENDGFI